MTTAISIVHILVCFVLILVILLQAGRGSGLSWGSFGGTPQSLLGTKSAVFLKKATSVCAIVFLFTCIGLNLLETQKSRSLFMGAKNQKIDVNQIKDVLEKIKSTESSSPNPAISPANPVTDKPNAGKEPPVPAAESQSGTQTSK